jgi:hypothetical protein
MALIKGALTDLKNKFLTTIHGRKFGIDHQGFTIGHNGQRLPYEQSTAASTLANYGVSLLTGSSADYTLGAPPAIGVTKTIVNGSSVAAAVMGIVRNSVSIGFGGSTAVGALSSGVGARLNLVNSGASVQLLAISSAVWMPVGSGAYASSAYPYIAVTTSS